MKSIILVFFFALTLSLTSSYKVQAQTEQTTVQTELNSDQILNAEPVEKVGFFKKLINSAKSVGIEMGIAFIFGLFAKNGFSKAIKAFSGKSSVVLKEIGETFIGGSNFFSVVNQAIKDDGSINQNSIAQVIASGKEVIAEANDVIISIKPKKV